MNRIPQIAGREVDTGMADFQVVPVKAAFEGHGQPALWPIDE
jgi:hypothetical protein